MIKNGLIDTTCCMVTAGSSMSPTIFKIWNSLYNAGDLLKKYKNNIPGNNTTTTTIIKRINRINAAINVY